jgi:hypothetical protein
MHAIMTKEFFPNPAKLSFKIDGAIINVFHDKQKLKQYMTTKLPLQKILQGMLHTESESKQNHERAGLEGMYLNIVKAIYDKPKSYEVEKN